MYGKRSLMLSVEELIKKASQEKPNPTRSQLDPYLEVISILREKHWTYDQIRQWLGNEGIVVTRATVTRFWNLRKGNNKAPRKTRNLPARPTSNEETQKLETVKSIQSPKPQGSTEPEVPKKKFEFTGFTKEDYEAVYQKRISRKGS